MNLHFSANSITTAREITHDARRYLVSPVVALREGVLNGVLVEAAEFAKYAQSWAGRPVPLGHPKNESGYISANSPDVWAADVPGHFWNVEVDGDSLRGEIWIDLAKAEAMGARAAALVQRLRLGQPVEVSTGYFADTEAASGMHNGKSYSGIARNIRPDHLALLPDAVGACSWADGCGTPRVHSVPSVSAPMAETEGITACGCGCNKKEEIMTELTPADVSANEHTLLAQAPQALFDKFLSWLGAGTPLGGQKPPPQDPISHQEEVEIMANRETSEAQVVEVTEVSKIQEVADVTPVPTAPDLDAVMARIAGLEEMLRGVTANVQRVVDVERQQVIASIVANAGSTWSEPDLQRFDTETLRKIHASSLPRDYSGNGGFYRHNDPEEEELVMHWPMFEKKEG